MKDLLCWECLGIEKQVSLNERERFCSGRKGIIKVFVVFFGDFEGSHVGIGNKPAVAILFIVFQTNSFYFQLREYFSG